MAIKADTQLTFEPGGHILTNTAVWSRDGKSIVYDVRSDPEGAVFDGDRIEKVDIATGKVSILYQAKNQAKCGVATWSPIEDKVVFILGPENPAGQWTYAANRRQGIVLDERTGRAATLDARDLVPPFTKGALRGGTHLHVFSGDGKWVCFTYEDHFLANAADPEIRILNARNVGVSLLGHPVAVNKNHPRNHDGSSFSVLVTRTQPHPTAGSDDILRAYEEGWIGNAGYRRPDGTLQRRAIAFLGNVLTDHGAQVPEVFVVDIPDDITAQDHAPLQGTEHTMPQPPKGTAQRRLTHTTARKHPGVAGPRHWVRSNPDGSVLAFLMKDDLGVVQIWTISPSGGDPKQITGGDWGVQSAFSWSPDGQLIACVMDNSVFAVDVATGRGRRLTEACDDGAAPLPLACVFSPDGHRIAYQRPVRGYNQIFIVELP